MPVINRIAAIHDEMTAWRRDIHAHPELGFQEERTAAVVAEKLESFGIQVHRGLAKTGVVGILEGTPGEGAIALRADMDALPILEANDVDHCSTNDGTMHACGHDGHTTMLLGAAQLPRRNPQLRRHGLLRLPAGRGGAGRRRGDGEGGAVRALPGERRLRHAQLARPAAGRDRRPHRADDGGVRRVHHHGGRHRRPRRHAPPRHRPHRGGVADGHRPAVHRRPQRGPA